MNTHPTPRDAVTAAARSAAQAARAAARAATQAHAMPQARGVARTHATQAADHARRATFHYLQACAVWQAWAMFGPIAWPILAIMWPRLAVAHRAATQAHTAAAGAAAWVAHRDALRDARARAMFTQSDRARAAHGVPLWARGTLPVERAAGVTAAPNMTPAGRVARALSAWSGDDHARGTAERLTPAGRMVWEPRDRRPMHGPAAPYTPTGGPGVPAPLAPRPAPDVFALWAADVEMAELLRDRDPWGVPTFPVHGDARSRWEYLNVAPAPVRPVPGGPVRPVWVSPVRVVWRVARRMVVTPAARWGKRVRYMAHVPDAWSAAAYETLGAWVNVPGHVVTGQAADPGAFSAWQAAAERFADTFFVAHGDVHHDDKGRARGVLWQRPDVWDTRTRRVHVRPDRVAFRGVSRDLSATDPVTGVTRRVHRGARVRVETARAAVARYGRTGRPVGPGHVLALRVWVAVTDGWARRWDGNVCGPLEPRKGRKGRAARSAARAAGGAVGKRGPARSPWVLRDRALRGAVARAGADAMVGELFALAARVDIAAAAGGPVTFTAADGTAVTFYGDGTAARAGGPRWGLREWARRAAVAGAWPHATAGYAWPVAPATE